MLAFMTPLLWKIAGGLLLVIALSGGFIAYKHSYDTEKIKQGYDQCSADAAIKAEANRIAAAKLNAEREALRAKTEAALRAKIAALYALKADACSEANALPGLLEGIPK